MSELKNKAQRLKRRAEGLHKKYSVVRTDGSSAVGKKHYGCEYFVLDLTHDPFAKPAIEAYIKACKKEYPVLAIDLLKALEKDK